jgi:multidrug resistance efflux pump
MQARKPGSHRLVRGAVALAICAGVALYIYLEAQPGDASLVGIVRETEIRIAPEIGGTLAAFLVKPGQEVRQGEALFVLDSPELAAALEEAKANEAAAKATRDNVYAGIRIEQVESLARGIAIADSNLTLAQQEYARAAALSSTGDTSKQARDEAAAALYKARAALALAQARYAAAKAGPTAEQRASADATLAASGAAVAVAQAQLDKVRPTAPADGTVDVQIAEPGEAVRAGEPVMTIAVRDKGWFSFTLREDRLKEMSVGSRIVLRSADGSRLPATVTELRPLGEFATWRATRAVGDHDLNSFLLRADPVAGATDLQPGMTVFIAPADATPSPRKHP